MLKKWCTTPRSRIDLRGLNTLKGGSKGVLRGIQDAPKVVYYTEI